MSRVRISSPAPDRKLAVATLISRPSARREHKRVNKIAHVAQSVERFLGKEEVHRFNSGRGLHYLFKKLNLSNTIIFSKGKIDGLIERLICQLNQHVEVLQAFLLYLRIRRRILKSRYRGIF